MWSEMPRSNSEREPVCRCHRESWGGLEVRVGSIVGTTWKVQEEIQPGPSESHADICHEEAERGDELGRN